MVLYPWGASPPRITFSLDTDPGMHPSLGPISLGCPCPGRQVLSSVLGRATLLSLLCHCSVIALSPQRVAQPHCLTQPSGCPFEVEWEEAETCPTLW